VVADGRIASVNGAGPSEGGSLCLDTAGDAIAVGRQWTVRVFILREAGVVERGQFKFVSSPPLPGKGESFEVSGRVYEVAYRRFRFCTFEGATEITVDLYVLGLESFDRGESE
jgi:hypothetical protein